MWTRARRWRGGDGGVNTVSDGGADEGAGGRLPGEAEEADPGRRGGGGERARVPRHGEARQDGVRAGPPPRRAWGLVAGLGVRGIAAVGGVIVVRRSRVAARHGRRSCSLLLACVPFSCTTSSRVQWDYAFVNFSLFYRLRVQNGSIGRCGSRRSRARFLYSCESFLSKMHLSAENLF